MWQVAVVANAGIALAYAGIAATILLALVRTRQLTTNRLGLATGTIFATCALGHAEHLVHLLTVPATRPLYGTHMIAVDIATAFVGVWYLTLRHQYKRLLDGPGMFTDLRARQRQALDLNDAVVQGLVVARYAHEVGDMDRVASALDETLVRARELISELLGTVEPVTEGDLVRHRPATVLATPPAGP